MMRQETLTITNKHWHYNTWVRKNNLNSITDYLKDNNCKVYVTEKEFTTTLSSGLYTLEVPLKEVRIEATLRQHIPKNTQPEFKAKLEEEYEKKKFGIIITLRNSYTKHYVGITGSLCYAGPDNDFLDDTREFIKELYNHKIR